MSSFQTIFLTLCGFVIVIGVALFAFSKTGNNGENVNLVFWGTLPEEQVTQFINDVKTQGILSTDSTVVYVQKDESTFSQALTEAIADGMPPDVVFVNQENLLENMNRLVEIPFESFPARDYKNTFIEESELFMTPTGIIAIPIAVDPLVTYWNRSIFTAAGIATVPSYWDEFLTLTPRLSQKDLSLNIEQSIAALGEYRNIPNAKEVLSALIMQAGSPIVTIDADGAKSVLDEQFNFALVPAQAALDFYTQFSNPAKSVYSWNRSLLPALDRFASGDAAMYFGFASELPLIREENPNLNFDIAPLLQSRTTGAKITFGRITGMAIVKGSPNVTASFATMLKLASAEGAPYFIDAVNQAPVRRDILAVNPNDPYIKIFYDAALQSKGWLDPNREKTENIFQLMIETVVSGGQSSSAAVRQGSVSIEQLLNSL